MVMPRLRIDLLDNLGKPGTEAFFTSVVCRRSVVQGKK
jgi:hypothetical protein